MSDDDEPVEDNPVRRSPQDDFEPVTEEELMEIEAENIRITRGFGA